MKLFRDVNSDATDMLEEMELDSFDVRCVID